MHSKALRITSTLGLAALLTASAGPAEGAEPSPVGRWQTIDDATGKPRSIVVISEVGGKLVGKIERFIPQPGEDLSPVCTECESERKGQPIVGMVVLWDLTKDGDEWSGGKALDPENGKTYRCLIKLIDDGTRLKVRGYIGFSLLGRSQYWKRVAQASKIG